MASHSNQVGCANWLTWLASKQLRTAERIDGSVSSKYSMFLKQRDAD